MVAQGNKLASINYVNLELYLASVVGSEMSAAAPIEALKAQAIAARSYEERPHIPPCELFV